MIIEPLKAYEQTAQDLLDNLRMKGIVVFSGGRVEVRQKLYQLAELIEDEGEVSFMAYSTINHMYSEIGYGYDRDLFKDEEVRLNISNYYDQYL